MKKEGKVAWSTCNRDCMKIKKKKKNITAHITIAENRIVNIF